MMRASTAGRGPKSRALPDRLSVNQFMWPDSTFADDVEVCQRAGIPGIGIWEEKLGSGQDAELLALFQQSGLQATVCAPAAPSILRSSYFGGPADPAERIDQLVASIKRFKPFAPAQFVTITGADSSLSTAEQRKVVVEGYRRAGAAAAEIGAVIGIEPIRIPDESLVATVAESADLVAEIDTDNVGIIWDVWHHWDSSTMLSDIESYAGLFTVVQLGDWPDGPNAGTDRAIPGEGVIPLDRMFSAVEAAGYTGWYDLEVLADPLAGDSIHKIGHDEMLGRCLHGLDAAWSKAGPGPAAR
jgi:sugar phosphate isomerase/epimerase